jgi:hypothetical protein
MTPEEKRWEALRPQIEAMTDAQITAAIRRTAEILEARRMKRQADRDTGHAARGRSKKGVWG